MDVNEVQAAITHLKEGYRQAALLIYAIAFLLGFLMGTGLTYFYFVGIMLKNIGERLERIRKACDAPSRLGELVDSTATNKKSPERAPVDLPIPAGIARPPRATSLGRKVDQGTDGPQQDQ